MRRVSLDISKLGLIVGDVIKLQLTDSVGKLMTSTVGFSLDVSITLDNNIFTYDLLESNNVNRISYYKLTLPNLLTFNFTLPSCIDGKPHDLLSLLSIGCFRDIIQIDGNAVKLDCKFIEKLNLYFTGENPHFNSTEYDLVKLYEYYAENVIDSISTIDIIKLMDIYLSTIKKEK